MYAALIVASACADFGKTYRPAPRYTPSLRSRPSWHGFSPDAPHDLRPTSPRYRRLLQVRLHDAEEPASHVSTSCTGVSRMGGCAYYDFKACRSFSSGAGAERQQPCRRCRTLPCRRERHHAAEELNTQNGMRPVACGNAAYGLLYITWNRSRHYMGDACHRRALEASSWLAPCACVIDFRNTTRPAGFVRFFCLLTLTSYQCLLVKNVADAKYAISRLTLYCAFCCRRTMI